jgi:hypothetical protein
MLLPSPVARAGEPASAADRLFEEGRALLDSEDYDVACERLAKSQKLDPALGTLALLAYCHEMLGRTATAYSEYRQALRMAKSVGDSEREQALRTQLDRLEPRLSRLRIHVPHRAPGIVVLRDGKDLDPSDWGAALAVDPGTIEVEARAPGHESWTADVKVGGDGARVELHVPELERSTSEGDSSVDVPVIIAFGVGVVGVGVGSYFGLRTKALDDDAAPHCSGGCDDEGFALREDARDHAVMSNVAFAVGAAGIGVGIVLLLTKDDEKESTSASALRLTPLADGGWASLEHRF